MHWNPTEALQPHISYATVGFGLIVYAVISQFLRKRLHLGEIPLGIIFGLIVGPHCLKWVDPSTWGNLDYIILEVSRVVLANEVFSVGLELPPKYMYRNAYTMFVLLLPVMAYGWMICSVFIWKLIPGLRWIDGLAVAGCVTATDPVLSQALIGKEGSSGDISEVISHMLGAESAANDGLALPFVYIALNVIRYEHHSGEIAVEVVCKTILYACVVACVAGAGIGLASRYLLEYAVTYKIIAKDWTILYHFCVILFCVGISSILGLDDLLLAFSAGSAFAWDGWFQEFSHHFELADLLTLLMNTVFFFFFGTIIPWEKFNTQDLPVWRLVVLSIIIMFVRRIPALLAIKPIVPAVRTWSNALLAGHFGPIGVCALFMAKLLASELEHGSPVPHDPGHFAAMSVSTQRLVDTLWPVTCFIVLVSVIVHGASLPIYGIAKFFGYHAQVASSRLSTWGRTYTYARSTRARSIYGKSPESGSHATGSGAPTGASSSTNMAQSV